MVRCPHCHAENRADSNFSGHCIATPAAGLRWTI